MNKATSKSSSEFMALSLHISGIDCKGITASGAQRFWGVRRKQFWVWKCWDNSQKKVDKRPETLNSWAKSSSTQFSLLCTISLVLSQVRWTDGPMDDGLCGPMDCSTPGSSVHGFSRQEHWSELPLPPPGDLPDPRITNPHESSSLCLLHWQGGSLPLCHLKALLCNYKNDVLNPQPG